jgi:uncharacterized protein
MRELDIEPALERFCAPYYEGKDSTHDIKHCKRILRIARRLAKGKAVDETLLIYGCFFHGLVKSDEQAIRKWFSRRSDATYADRAVACAKASHKDAGAKTIEEKIVHDAHLLEGGTTYLLVKSLITGAERGQTLNQTLTYLEKNILGKYRCHLPEARKEYREMEKFAKTAVQSLRKNLT